MLYAKYKTGTTVMLFLLEVQGSPEELTRVVAVPGAYMFQIQITKTYNTTNLLEDIKGLYKIAGLKGQKVAFIFTCAACLYIYCI